VDIAVGQHMHVAAAGLVEVFAPRGGGVGDRGGHRHADAQHLVGGGHAPGGAVADDDARGAGAHQMQRRAVVLHTAGDHRHVELGDEGLQVQRLAIAGDALRRHDAALDDQQVDAGREQHRCQRLRVLRADPHRGGHSRVTDAGHRGAQQVRVQRRRMQLLQQPDRRRGFGLFFGGLDKLRDLGPDVGVPADQPLAVEHTQAAEPAELDRELRRHQRIGRVCHHRDLEPVGVQLPRCRHVLRRAGAP
jgi:hypothetical protein